MKLPEGVLPPLKPEVDYCDATTAIEMLAGKIQQIEQLFHAQLAINQKLTDNLNQLLLEVDELRTEKARNTSSIIMPGHNLN